MPLLLGGQAVYEGVMLRSPNFMTIAVRTSKGEIALHSEPLKPRQRFWKYPFLRGVIALYDAIALGLRGLRLSMQMALPEEEKHIAEPHNFAWQAVLGLLLAVTLFVALPHIVSSQVPMSDRWIFSGFEGIVRLFVFVLFLWFVGRSKEAQRIFAYHGAEHKAVHAFELNRDLSVESLKPLPPEHPRCGTAFLIFVLLVKILLFAFLPIGGWQGVLTRIVMLPVVASVSFELLRLGATKPFLSWLSLPGIWLQKLTTNEPDEQQLEVALTALKEVLRLEGVHAHSR
ncbi:MAG: DUF1385 domain-containing protein [Armatimonadetes bacterium]|nr:DUF1385 domain-containing protein [Armatimonadota bacterium]MCX7968241.1 DUF1385 domain-containing protein [Armatimonadota bacterium]MDW8143005.1 DUF1385 domain-containing protein [Armatimonadota bacterium]